MKRWVNRYRINKHINRRPQPGQKRKLDLAQRNAVVQKIIDDPFLNAAIVAREFKVNKNTIRKIWNESGKYHGVAAKKPFLTQEQREARVGYALENLTRDSWDNVIFSDEKTFQSDRHQRLHVYRPKNCRYDDRFIHETRRSGRISSGVWAWIGKDGPGEMTLISRRLNSVGYVEILEDVLKPTVEICYGGFQDMVFMQVNSRNFSLKT